MSSKIPIRLLNRLVAISSLSSTPNQSGDVDNTESVISLHTPMRIGMNRRYGAPGTEQTVEGIISVSTHEAFCLPGVTIVMGNIVTDEADGESFTVNYVNNSPGGIKTHHMEIFLQSVDR